MRYDDPKLITELAGQYVLGTLHGRARGRFERLMRERGPVQQAVSDWEARLQPLADAVPGVAPPARVWDGIQQRLGLVAASRKGPWRSLGLWRGISAVAAVMLLALSLNFYIQPAPEAMPNYLAVLEDTHTTTPMVVATVMKKPWRMKVKVLRPTQVETGQDLEMWIITEEGKPMSVGMVPEDGEMTIMLAEGIWKMMDEADVLAVSLEPKGGSPTGSPSGPVLMKGHCVTLT